MTKYDRLFNIRVRNAKCIFHDCCKLILVALLKEKHPNTEVYTEYNPDNPNKSYPDIWIKIKNRRYVYEIQKADSVIWRNSVIRKYDIPNYDLIIVPIKNLPRNFDELVDKLKEFVI